MGTLDDLQALVSLCQGRRLFVLVGAGCSTESGIPDYRGPGTLQRARNPIQYRDFVEKPEARQRYWARSARGWPAMRAARPNPAHLALAQLEQRKLAPGIVTQNVDGLHQAAGNQQVIELHGALREVYCLHCGAIEDRDDLQRRIEALNPSASLAGLREMAPDGDAEIDAGPSFRVPDCERCGGTLKPNVVFFGENVPRERVERSYGWLSQCDAVLVVGSSLTVFSGYRFVKRAAELGLPIAVVNLGPTRASALASVHVDGRAGEILPALVERLA